MVKSPLYGIYPPRTRVNSFHHQAVKKIGGELCGCAVSDDGYTEGIYLPGNDFFIGVQWHPEHMIYTDECAANLFGEFIKSALVYMAKKEK